MLVVANTPELLMLRANRILPGAVCVVAAPFVVGLGQVIVEKSDNAWLGWVFAVLGAAMVLGGIWALFAKLTLKLDRRAGAASYALDAPLLSKHWEIPLEALDAVDLHERHSPRGSIYTLAFRPRSGSAAPALRVREFWTKGAADEAFHAVRSWLREAGHPAGRA